MYSRTKNQAILKNSDVPGGRYWQLWLQTARSPFPTDTPSGFEPSIDFIEAVSPQIAIVSCGKSERYPGTDVAMTLVELGAEIYTTHKEGDITVIINENGEMTLSSDK